MILVFLAVFLFLLVIIPIFLVLRYGMTQRFWQEISYFDESQIKRYKTYAVLLFASGLCIQYQTGVILPFTSRLVMWACACALMGLFLTRMFGFKANYTSIWKRPVTGLMLIVMALFAIDMLNESGTQRELIRVNQWFSIAGLLLVAGAIEFFRTWGKPQTITPCRRRDKRAVDKRRYTTGYLWYVSGLLYLAAVVPASLIAFTAHDYLLQRQAIFEASHIKQSMLTHQLGYEDYLSFLNAKPCSPESVASFPCSMAAGYRMSELTSSFYPNTVQASSVTDCQLICTSWVLINSEPGTNVSRPDSFFNKMFSITPSQTEFVSHLTFAAKQDLTGSAPPLYGNDLGYRADLLMLVAVREGSGPILALIMFLGLPLGIYLAARQLLVQRLMGEHLQDQYRVLPNCAQQDMLQNGFPNITTAEGTTNIHSLLILNATRLQAETALNHQPVLLFQKQVFRLPECLGGGDNGAYFLAEVEQAVNSKPAQQVVVAISAVEQVSTNTELRQQALSFLYRLHNKAGVTLIVIAETAPLYRLLNPSAYEAQDADYALSSDEKAGWSKLFSELTKRYAWSPVQKHRLTNPFDINLLIDFECSGWPELTEYRVRFEQHTLRYKKIAEDADHQEQVLPLADFWEPEQVIEFMLENAGALYRRKWEECTRLEKLILWKLANGASINPANALIIERLVRRGYLFRDKGWSIINESFRQFILTAENESVISVWLANANSGAWSVLRIPVFALLLVLMVIFVYSSGSSLSTLLSVATATLGLIPLLLKNLSLLKGGVTTDIN